MKHLNQCEAQIAISDVSTCNIMIVPSVEVEDHYEVNNEYEMDYLVQIILCAHGQRLSLFK